MRKSSRRSWEPRPPTRPRRPLLPLRRQFASVRAAQGTSPSPSSALPVATRRARCRDVLGEPRRGARLHHRDSGRTLGPCAVPRSEGRGGLPRGKWGGFVDDFDRFDPLFFNISPREAPYLDPQERLFLQCAWETLEDAGYTRESVAPSGDGVAGGDVGVFVGVMYEEYQLYGAESTAAGRPLALSGSAASIANRVSYFCDFHGPSMAVDSMCSSSLTAIHLACEALRAGDCSIALAGGVNLTLHPNKYLALAQGDSCRAAGAVRASARAATAMCRARASARCC